MACFCLDIPILKRPLYFNAFCDYFGLKHGISFWEMTEVVMISKKLGEFCDIIEKLEIK